MPPMRRCGFENKMVLKIALGKEVSNIILQRKQLRLRHNLC